MGTRCQRAAGRNRPYFTSSYSQSGFRSVPVPSRTVVENEVVLGSLWRLDGGSAWTMLDVPCGLDILHDMKQASQPIRTSCEQRCRAERIRHLRSLSATDCVALFAELYRLASTQQDAERGMQRLQALRRQEKRTLRRRLHMTFAEVDRIRRERANPQDVG